MVKVYGAVDLGATNLRVGIGKRAIEEKISLATPKTPSDITATIIQTIERLVKKRNYRLKGIGIASIGPLDIRKGILRIAPNLPFRAEVQLVKPLVKKFRVPVRLMGDCIAAVLAEKYFGAGKDVKNLVYVTLSTGIGGGAIVDNHLLLGKDGSAVHVGHLVIDLEKRLRCGCGGYGHWEAYCSGANIPRFVRLLWKKIGDKHSAIFKLSAGLRDLTAEMVFDCAKRGDEVAKRLVEEIGRLNAIGFANLVNAFDPELITVGGAVALKNPALVLRPIRRYLKNYTINRIPKIMITPLGEDASLLGAFAIAKGLFPKGNLDNISML